MMEQVKFLENFIDKHASSIIRTKPLHAKVMSSVEESSLVESKHEASLDSTYEPSPKPRTPKETMLHHSKFPIEFGDYGNTLKYFGHEKLSCPSKEVSPKVKPSKEGLLKVKRSSKAIQILSPSMTIPCSLRGTNIEALHNPIVKTSIMSEFLAKKI
jgi:hypothetical protein